MASEEPVLHVVDYAVFVGMLLISLGIGIYHAVTGDRQRTTDQYLLGNRRMHLLPVTISMLVTYISTLTTMGFPTEVFAFGVQFWMGTWGSALGVILACFVFLPVLYPLQITSVNEYLEVRYESKLVKYLGCIFATGGMVFYAGNVLFAPCTAIQAMSGFPSWAAILICSAIAIIYTSIGGFQAVIWTDVFQSFLMLLGLIAVLVQGTILVGGFGEMWKYLEKWDRLNFFDFDPDPTKRLNFYGVIFANALSWTGYYGYLQIGVQRYSSLPTMRQARLSVLGVIPGNTVLMTLSCLCGMVVFAYYAKLGCDPKVAGHISNHNQILPYFVADVFRIPGISGIFLSSLLAASLSTASSAMNSSAANIWVDILREHFPNISQLRAAFINKIIVMLFGVASMLVAIGIDSVGGTLLQISGTFHAAFGGPASALFFMGMLCPWASWKGVTIGSLFGFVSGVWLCTGSFLTPKNWQELPSPSNCTWDTSYNATGLYTTPWDPTTYSSHVDFQRIEEQRSALHQLYSISFLWLREIVCGITIVTGIAFSFITGFLATNVDRAPTGARHPSNIPRNLIHPWWRNTFQFAEDVHLTSGTPNEKLAKAHSKMIGEASKNSSPSHAITSI